MNRIQSKNLDIGLYRGNKISLSSYDDIYIYIYDGYIYMVDIYIYMMDIAGYHIFINLIVNHLKIMS